MVLCCEEVFGSFIGVELSCGRAWLKCEGEVIGGLEVLCGEF